MFIIAFALAMSLTFLWVLWRLTLQEATRLFHYRPKPPPKKLLTWLQCPTSYYYSFNKQNKQDGNVNKNKEKSIRKG